jgi:hypothetical protein
MQKIALRFALSRVLSWLPIFSATSHARDMQGRFGLGYNSQFATGAGVPGVSAKYALTRDIAFELAAGLNTASPVASFTGLKFFKNIFYETNLNFYFVLGGAMVSANNVTGAQFLGGFGAEFFIPGIESLGFAVETGGSLDNLGGSFALKSMGVSFLNAGIHFYF